MGDATGIPETINSIRLLGVPADAVLSAGTQDGPGAWSLTPDQLAGLTLTPPPQWSGTLTLQVEVVTQHGAAPPLTTLRPINVAVVPVADAPALAQAAPAIGNEDSAIALGLSLTRFDLDGSELVSVMVEAHQCRAQRRQS